MMRRCTFKRIIFVSHTVHEYSVQPHVRPACVSNAARLYDLYRTSCICGTSSVHRYHRPRRRRRAGSKVGRSPVMHMTITPSTLKGVYTCDKTSRTTENMAALHAII